MPRHHSDIDPRLIAALRKGAVLPAHPLALDSARQLDVTRQRALTRYYLDAGATGVAVGVHTTQFAIRTIGLYEPVLRIAAETAADWQAHPALLVAGVTGRTGQAVKEADIARELGYHAALLNVAAFKGASEAEVLDHCRRVAAEIPIIGFALLPAVGGFHLSYGFWREFAAIENAIAIKMAPFDRYRTLDIVRAVVDAGAADRVTLYTGNDDHIVLDLLQPFAVRSADGRSERRARIRGGLLGHWSVWTKSAVDLLARIHALPDDAPVPVDLLAQDSIVTDCNGAIYDAAHNLAGCIPGCLEVLRRQGLMTGITCLDPNERLSPGQAEEIDRVYAQYPEMNDDAFVGANLDRWLSERGAAVPLVA
ncbi:dihydrodipicolinate synthase family protein [Chelatococcus asaccharovorans]|uniref:Dihydrodipicolinate synthetase family protein n=1 Tax=Chelatococcus asaccharovorans TaxID=28210 RepID=A0A2V3U3W7_9HYPH|nr:dihydrodipicolinate synthase family protein [Chelatococcus asaccharovorans]MBS7702891.1 dihydrodipicolinate synthase family protein [Chelatococcus asaccharovorans]PXW57191.1 dihydrodipicolinate synthetase family protein [Chelatococcus asaccharovorans]